MLSPFIDPILAPLETGESGYSPETLSDLGARFRQEREKANIDDKEMFGLAATIADILREAVEDRSRHIERLIRVGAPVRGAVADDGVAADHLTDTERKHLEAAVGISWQRNSGAYRNRVEELGLRLVGLEGGRFLSGSSPDSQPAAERQNP